MNTRDIKLDLSKEFIPSQMVIIGQGDSGGTTIRATILDNSVPVTLTGATAYFKMRLPNGKDFYEGSCTVSGSTVTHVVDESHAASVFGYTDEAYFEITLDGHTYSTSRFRVKVERAATDGATPSGSWTDVVEEFIEDAQEQLDDYEAEKSAEIGRATTTMVDTVNQAASNANQAATNANQAATSAEDRIEAAIEAAGEISELAVPLMSSDIRGGSKLDEQGGLALRDGSLGIGSLVQESDGAVRGPIAGLTAEGWAEQKTTTGKNLLQPHLINTTSEGISWSNNSNGEVVANGTATSEIPSTYFSRTLAAGTYTASGASSEQQSLFRATVNGNVLFSVSNRTSAVFTLESDTTIDFRFFVYRNAGTYTNYVFDCQIELGSTATEYEPYTGGAPSPSPDYPQEIQVVRGRNLLDESKSKYQKLVADGTVTAEGSTTNYLTTDFIEVEPSSTYYVQNVAGTNTAVTCCFYDTAKTFTRAPIIYGTNSSVAVTTDANTRYVRFTYFSQTSDQYVGPPQLTLGSTPTPYVPYGHVGLDRDILNSREANINNAWLGTSGTMGGYSSVYAVSTYIPVDAGETYILLSNYNGSDSTTINAAFYTESKAFISRVGYSASFRSITFIAPANAKYLSFTYRMGAVPTLYAPSTPIPLPERGWVGSLPDGTADKLTLDGAGKVTWENVCGMHTYEVSDYRDTWGDSNVRDVYTHITSRSGDNILCDKFIAAINVINISYTLWVNSGIITFRFAASTGITTGNAAKEFLEVNTPTVLYPLATPITEEAGYVDLPEIPSDAVVSIRELDNLGVKYFVDGSASTLAHQWYERARSEYEDRIASLESAVADLVTGA